MCHNKALCWKYQKLSDLNFEAKNNIHILNLLKKAFIFKNDNYVEANFL